MKSSWMILFCSYFILSCQSTQIIEKKIASTKENEEKVKYYTNLADYPNFSYEVLFTDPLCGPYEFTEEMKSNSGKSLKFTPKNVYCKNLYDLSPSGKNPLSPQYRIIQWIDELIKSENNDKEIFFTYLSFRNKAVKNKLIEAAKKGVKIKFVLSSSEDQTAADELVAANPEIVKKYKRGLEGDLGYAHNKFFIINPNSKDNFKIVFSSGNMTSGPVIHHENWNFIQTKAYSNFAQSHLCAMKAEIDEEAGRSRVKYIAFIKQCREKIQAPEEDDIKVFFVPGEGEPAKGVTKRTAVEFMLDGDGDYLGINSAQRIWIGCHRFFYSKMINALKARVGWGLKNKPDLRIVADDDTYYKAKDPNYSIGDTMPQEYYHIENLVKAGAKAKFMQTNGEEHQLHHSKYLIFLDKENSEESIKSLANDQFLIGHNAVFTGSANLTGAGFNKNWENSYYIKIPTVVKQFAQHYVKMWNEMATDIKDLPEHGMISSQISEKPFLMGTQE